MLSSLQNSSWILAVGHLRVADSCRQNGGKCFLSQTRKDNRFSVHSTLIIPSFNFWEKVVVCNSKRALLYFILFLTLPSSALCLSNRSTSFGTALPVTCDSFFPSWSLGKNCLSCHVLFYIAPPSNVHLSKFTDWSLLKCSSSSQVGWHMPKSQNKYQL